MKFVIDFDDFAADESPLGDPPYNLLVYGTLMAGYGNHGRLGDSIFMDIVHTKPEFTMSGRGVPIVWNRGTTSIRTEWYQVHDRGTLHGIDSLEGHPNNYKRTLLTPDQLILDTEQKQALLKDGAYIYLFPSMIGTRYYYQEIIESGDFRDGPGLVWQKGDQT